MATATIAPASRRLADRAARLITSDEPADILQGVHLMLSLPREARADILTATRYHCAKLAAELAQEEEAESA